MSVRSPRDSPTAESPTSSEASTIGTLDGSAGGEMVIFESYLYKIPPLKKSILMKSWSKKWFILRQTDLNDSNSIELCYFKDNSKKEKRHVIDLSSIVGIRPTPKISSAENIFAIETKDKKYILKAADANIKNVWLAKLCEYCGQEPVFHVTVPYQPPVTIYNEAILKLSDESHVTIMLPSTSETLLCIQYGNIRRMGYTHSYNADIIWFETCKNSQADRFFFIVVPSGMDVAKQIVQELKAVIQAHTSSILILEDCTGVDLSYIAREHYGCAEYSADSRTHILQTGLYHLPNYGRFFVMNDRSMTRKESAPLSSSQQDGGGVGGVSLEEFGRRKSKTMKGPPPSLARRPTLDKFVRQNSVSSFDRQASNLSSFERHASVTSFDRSVLSTPSLDRDMASPSLHELSEGHYSSSSASDVFDSPTTQGPPPIQRKLSVQSSISSQGSSNSSISHSPAILEEEGLEDETFSFNTVASSPQQQRSYSCSGISGPIVPPRSVVSLQQDAYLQGKLTAAH